MAIAANHSLGNVNLHVQNIFLYASRRIFAAIAQLALQPDVVIEDAFIGIELLHLCLIDSDNLAIDGLFPALEHRIAL